MASICTHLVAGPALDAEALGGVAAHARMLVELEVPPAAILGCCRVMTQPIQIPRSRDLSVEEMRQT